jgi:hypothetical protein
LALAAQVIHLEVIQLLQELRILLAAVVVAAAELQQVVMAVQVVVLIIPEAVV